MSAKEENPDIKIGGNVNGIIANGDDNDINVTQQMAPKPFNDKGVFMPTVRNTLFTGREDALAALAAALSGDKNVVITQAITGMGGLGKSQLALEFAYRSADNFVSAHWLNLMDPSQLNSEIAACGRQMGLLDDSAKQPDMVAETLRVWALRGPRLLVLDNYESAADAMQTLAPLLTVPTLRLLITARRAEFPPELGLHAYPLEVFTPTESVQFIRKLVKLKEDQTPDIEKLAETLGHLPLALHLAGHYLRVEGITPAEYLIELDEVLSHESMQAAWFAQMDIKSPTQHEQSLLGTFELSWRKVTDETAQTIFKLAGYLAPNEPIPLEIFEKTIFENSDDDNSILDNSASTEPNIESSNIGASGASKQPRIIRKAINHLKNIGLFTIKNDLPVIHPLLTAYARHLDGTPSILLEKLADQLSSLASDANAQVNQSGSLTWFARLQAHVQTTAEHAEKAGLQAAAYLYNSLGYYLRKVANNVEARAAYEHAISILEASLGENHPYVATVVNNLGLALKYLGDLPGARAAYERSLKIGEATLGENDPKIAIRINNLGAVMKAQGDLFGARAAYERAIKIDEAAFGKDHPEVATDINNLGDVLKALGDSLGARDAYERALKIAEAAFGKDHPKVAISVLNLGTVLQVQGETAQARTCYERALVIFEHFLPAGHPDIELAKSWLQSLDNLS